MEEERIGELEKRSIESFQSKYRKKKYIHTHTHTHTYSLRDLQSVLTSLTIELPENRMGQK